MSTEKKKNILFIEAKESMFHYETQLLDKLFGTVERVNDEQKALKLVYKNDYDAVICDVSGDVIEGTTFMKQVKQMKPEQEIYTLVISKDEENIGGLIDAGIHSFVLEAEQFEQAMETIATL